ncbi:MAG: M23 family metallopeptidase [Candidatus Gracilibacteria bacterium]
MKTLVSLFAVFFVTTSFILQAPQTAQAVTFRRPLNQVLNPAISYYYDTNATASMARYNCAQDKVYNNHRGTDFRAVVGTNIYAAAGGGIFQKNDGCPTYGFWGSACGGGYGNHVRLDHEAPENDGRGWVSIYGHMKLGTATQLINVAVNCGTLIGKTGSSGNSTGPHMHFEVRKYAYPGNDPFLGACSRPLSFWTRVGANGVPTTECSANAC